MDRELNQYEDNMEAFDPNNFSAEGQPDEDDPASSLNHQLKPR